MSTGKLRKKNTNKTLRLYVECYACAEVKLHHKFITAFNTNYHFSSQDYLFIHQMEDETLLIKTGDAAEGLL